MGNSADSNNFTLEEFIATTNIDSMNLDNHQILLKAYKIYTMFKSNPNVYKEFKEEEEKNTIKRNIISNIDKEEEKDNLNPKGISLSNYRRFQLILCNAILRTYDDSYVYIILIKIFKYLLNEKDLFRLFIKNCIEQICTLINNLEIPVDIQTQIEGIELLIMILNLFKENVKLIKLNFQSISKIFQICKKINEVKIRNDLRLNIYFIKLIEESIEFLFFIQSQIKFDMNKDFSNFLLQQLSEFHSNGIFYNLVNNIDNNLIKNIIEVYYLEKEFVLLDEFNNIIIENNNNNNKQVKKNEDEKTLKEKKYIHDKIDEEINKNKEEYKKKLNKKIHDNNFFKKEDYKENYIFDDTYPFLIIKIYKILLNINITFEEKIIQPNEEIEKLINLILLNEDVLIDNPFIKNENNNNNTSITTNNTSNLNDENEGISKQESEHERKLNILFYYFVNEFSCNILSFLIHFNINYCLNSGFKDNIIYIPNFNPFYEKKFRKTILIFYRLYINNDYIHLKFLISILFYELSITQESFKIFNELNLISSPHTLILIYVQETFNPNIIDIKSEEYKKRLKNILKFIETSAFISEDKIFNTIKHTELFTIYIDVISLLFYINNPIFRNDMIRILNKFTLYSDIKNFYLEKKNHCVVEMILKRMDDLFIELRKSNKLHEDIEIQKRELNENIEKESDDNKYKLIENLSLLENLTNHTKHVFVMACTEFGYLISIIVNLIMNNQFDINLKLLLGNKIEEYFLFDEDLANFKSNFLNESLNETPTPNEEKDIYIGKLLYYHIFFQKLNSLKQEINKPQFNNRTLSKFTFQLPLAVLMFNPTIQIVFTKNEGDYFSETKGDTFNINSLIELIKTNLNDYQILHKLLFTTSRFFCKQNNFKEIVDNLKKLLEILNNLLLKNNELPLYLSREIFRLFGILSSGNNNSFLWMKFQNDINTVTFDSSNNNDVMLKYNNENLNWNLNEQRNIFENAYNNSFNNQSLAMDQLEKVKKFMSSKKLTKNSTLLLSQKFNSFRKISNNTISDLKTIKNFKYRFELNNKDEELIENSTYENATIKILPYFKVKPFNDKMGIITYDKHHFILPKPISLIKEKDSSFTIWFRFYNPVINTKKWHTLLQDETGLISLVCINDKGDRLGCFNKNGDFIDSGINLLDKNLQNQWIQIAIGLKSLGTADGSTAKGEIKFYLNGMAVLNKVCIYKNDNNSVKENYSNKCVFPDNIQFIGNSRDYNEPFGVFCDLRIYKEFKEPEIIKKLFEFDENEKKNLILDYVDIVKLLYEKVSNNSINYVLNTKTLNHEVLLFIVKFFNVLMNNSLYRGKFINFRLVMKIIEEGFSYDEREELKKELCKYLQILG